MADRCAEAKQAIRRLLWKLHEIETTVCDFNGDQELLFRRLDEYVAELAQLRGQHAELNFEVPVELLRSVDDGGNPDTFTSNLFKEALRANQVSVGKARAFGELRDAVQAQLAKHVPDDLAAYLDLTGGGDGSGGQVGGEAAAAQGQPENKP